MRWILPIPVFLVLATPAFATDGMNEINQTCAVLTGCFVGDSAGFPVTLGNAPGRSYRLTGDLVVPDGNTTAISVVASGVNLDLGGFEIRGANLCTKPIGGTLFCTFSGSGVGISATGNRVAISDGSIAGMGGSGIYLVEPPAAGSGGHVIHDIRVAHNGSDGIRVSGDAVTVREVTATSNKSTGIALDGVGSMVVGSTADQNGSVGISVAPGGTVTGNSSSQNGADGIRVSRGIVSNNSVSFNEGFGINITSDATISTNTAISNFAGGIIVGLGSTVQGNTVKGNFGHGILASGGVTVQGNTVRENTGFGLSLSTDVPPDPDSYRENTISRNTAGTVTGLGINNGNNVCNGSLICP